MGSDRSAVMTGQRSFSGRAWASLPATAVTLGTLGMVFGLVIAAVPAASAAPGSAVPHRAASGTWAIQHTPNPPSRQGDLAGISCTSAACIAVGHYNNFSNTVATLAEVWNGTSWSIQKTATPAGTHESYLTSVSCTAAVACTAVGFYRNSQGIVVTLAERWNGTSWSIQPTPDPTGNGTPVLFGVACTSASACTAVGTYQTAKGVPVTLAEAWNGSSWSIQPTPNPSVSVATFLYGVDCTSPTACTAVGSDTFRPNNLGGASTGTLAEVRS